MAMDKWMDKGYMYKRLKGEVMKYIAIWVIVVLILLVFFIGCDDNE